MMQVYKDTEEGRKVCKLYGLSHQRKPVTLFIDPHTTVMRKSWEGFIDARAFLEVRL